MLNKKIKFYKFNTLRLKVETFTFLLSSISALLFTLFIENDVDQHFLSIALIFFIVFFGLPHGALDSLIAKKFKIYKNFYEFLIFNFAYILLALFVFIIWYFYSLLSLIAFLLLSAYHFSEDWKIYGLSLTQKLSLGFSVINLPILFHADKVKTIYFYLTNSNYINNFASIQFILAYINLFLLFYLMAKNYNSLNILLQCILIISTAYILDPIFFFITYFCFFHSTKNFIETSNFLSDFNRKKIYSALLFNTIFSIIIGIILYISLFKEFNIESISFLIFVGLAALTVPHMALRFLVSLR